MKKIRTVIPSAWDKPTNTTEQIIIVNIIVISIFLFIIAKLSQAQSNFNSVGWAEIALIPTFTHPPTPRESTELSSAQLNPTPTQLVGLIGSRISLKPA